MIFVDPYINFSFVNPELLRIGFAGEHIMIGILIGGT